MVVLSRIYTKTGDRGTTALGSGKRVPKDHPRIEAYGTVDELNSVIGLALASGCDPETAIVLKRIQNDLFDLGADLCVPESPQRDRPGGRRALRMTAGQGEYLEKAIDRFNAPLSTLRARRAERVALWGWPMAMAFPFRTVQSANRSRVSLMASSLGSLSRKNRRRAAPIPSFFAIT